MKRIHSLIYGLSLLALVLFAGCKDPVDPIDPNEEELITKVQLSFSEVGNPSNAFTATYSDPDGDGGNNAVQFDTIRLDSGRVYNARIALYDESDPGNIENITNEVQAEADAHLFCYTVSGPSVSILRTDSDGTYEIGIATTWTASGIGTGTVLVELKHQPEGQKNGTCAPGATDVSLNFVLEVM